MCVSLTFMSHQVDQRRRFVRPLHFYSLRVISPRTAAAANAECGLLWTWCHALRLTNKVVFHLIFTATQREGIISSVSQERTFSLSGLVIGPELRGWL